MTNKKTSTLEDKKVSILIYCTSDLILSGILKALEPATDLEVVNIEKSTIDVFIESIKGLKPQISERFVRPSEIYSMNGQNLS